MKKSVFEKSTIAIYGVIRKLHRCFLNCHFVEKVWMIVLSNYSCKKFYQKPLLWWSFLEYKIWNQNSFFSLSYYEVLFFRGNQERICFSIKQYIVKFLCIWKLSIRKAEVKLLWSASVLRISVWARFTTERSKWC